MGWPYAFVSLDNGQLALRRQLLDRYANIAQVSVIVPILVLQILFLASWLRQRPNSTPDAPSSPVIKRAAQKSNASRAALTLRKFSWWCGDEIELQGRVIGRRGELLGGIAWAVWLLVLTLIQTQGDYLHLTKRFGIVAASQLPFHYLLAMKTPYSPLQYITQASHETLNSIHQILGRTITVFLYAHAGLYLNFYIQSNLLEEKLQQPYIKCGMVGVVMLTLIGTSSLAIVRKWSYRIFLGVHILLSIALLPVLFFHVHHIRLYIYETLAVLVLNLVTRALAARSYSDATLKLLSDSQLVEVSIPVAPSTKGPNWQPGQHAYVSLAEPGPRAAVSKMPLSLASIPSAEKQLRFVARVQAGNTAALAAAASSTTKMTHPVLVEGPYGVATHADRLLQYDRVLLVAGGVGGTFIRPLYQQLLSDLSPSKGSYRRQKVSFVWIARSAEDVAWAVSGDKKERESFLERLKVFVTRSVTNGDVQQRSANDETLFEGLPGTGEDTEGIELEERNTLLKDVKDTPSTPNGESDSLPISSGRPNIARLIDQAFAGGASERVAIMVCGPAALGKAVRSEVERWVDKGREVWFWNEAFAL